MRIFRGDASALPAARTIDAHGHVVAPGFIDMHSHAGLTILHEPRHEPKVRQGVTTELIGIDGNSHAPFKTREDLHRYIELDSGLNGEPPMPTDWLTVAGQLSMFDNKVAVNICFILGNSPVRIWSVGWDDRPATRAELDDMKSVVREVCEEGSFGLSTGLDYPPGSYADTHELIELSKVVARGGGFYHTHTRALLKQKGLLAPWMEALEIGRAADIAVHFTHYRQRSQGDGSHLDYIGLVERSRDEGLDVTFDCYPYVYGSTRANIWLPGWTMDGGPERLAAVLDSPKERARLRQEMQARNALGRTDEGWLTNFRKPENMGYEGRSLLDISRERGQDPLDTFLDLMRSEGHSLCAIMIGTNPQTLPAFVSHPCGMVGERRHPARRVSESPDLRVLSGDPRGVRPRGEAPAIARGHSQDDVVSCPAARPARSWAAARRHEGGHRDLRPQYREGHGDAATAQAVPAGDSLRDRQRQSRRRQGRAHRRAAGARTSLRSLSAD